MHVYRDVYFVDVRVRVYACIGRLATDLSAR